MLIRHGYGLLLLDARGYDGSQGDPNLFGWDDTKDIDAAVAWLQHRPDVRDRQIGGIGFSVGGEMMLQAAAENQGLRAVVSEGAGFRSVREELLRGPSGWFTSLPEQAVQSTALAVMSGTAPPPSLKTLIPRIAPRHVFPIYAGQGGDDEEYNLDYYRAAHTPKQRSRKHTTPAASRLDPTNTSGASPPSSTRPCSERSEPDEPSRRARRGRVSPRGEGCYRWTERLNANVSRADSRVGSTRSPRGSAVRVRGV